MILEFSYKLFNIKEIDHERNHKLYVVGMKDMKFPLNGVMFQIVMKTMFVQDILLAKILRLLTGSRNIFLLVK